MIFVLLTLALAIIPPETATGVAVELLDRVEINHVYDEHGQLVLSQIMFSDWSPCDGRFNVIAWRLVSQAAQRPQRNWQTGRYHLLWHDGEVLRSVEAQSFHESWTQYDVEMEDRNIFPKQSRRGLCRAESGE